MTWQTVYASETDANSPLNQTLMDKIREDLNGLAESSALLGLEEEKSASVPGSTWTTIKNGMIFIPDFLKTMSAKVEGYVTLAADNKKIRLKIENGAGGYNYSDEQPPPTGSYGYVTLTAPASGNFVGAGDWRQFWVEVRHTESTARTFYVRKAVIKTASV